MLYSVSEGYRTFLRYPSSRLESYQPQRNDAKGIKMKDERLKIVVSSKEDTKGIRQEQFAKKMLLDR